jgi:drug/metabolite transporter (DMT)-like permease
MRTQDIARLVALALIWSASFVFIRVLAPLIGPLWVATGRVLIAGLALAGWLAATGVTADLRTKWRAYLLLGVLNCALPFVLWGYAALHLPASYLVILNAMTPLWVALLAALFVRERMGGGKAFGLVAGLAGVVLVTRAVPASADAQFALAVSAGVGAALCYAVSALWLRHRGGALPPLANAAWTQLFAGVVLLPFAVPSHVNGPITPLAVGDLLALALICSGVAYILYFRLIRDIGPTRALTVTFLMPAFGMVWGAWLLGEVITPGMIVGAALIVVGTAAVLGMGSWWWRARRRIVV